MTVFHGLLEPSGPSLLAKLAQPPRCRLVAGGRGELTPLAFDVAAACLARHLPGRGQIDDGAGATLR